MSSIPRESYQPFLHFAEQILPQSRMRTPITTAYRRPETEAISALIDKVPLLPDDAITATNKMAHKIAEKLRSQKNSRIFSGFVQGLLQEFSLSSREGVALMCLAEALLRIPDQSTRDALIRDKIIRGNWDCHLGNSPSIFVNAAAWGLIFTRKVLSIHSERQLSNSLNRIISKSGKSLIGKVMNMTMRFMGAQFVAGETILAALAKARKLEHKGFCYSYDILGEAALTEYDAQVYLLSYQNAIHAIGKASGHLGIYKGPGISIKLSALHPRYSRAQYSSVMQELYPRLLELTLQARQYDIGINIDAEESDRLDISLDLLEKLCFESHLSGWNGIGFVVQAYQKRCPFVIDALIDMAQRSRRRLMIRLVKGAYWDGEIKSAQINGLDSYPVYTRKVYTDLSYLVCARKLLEEPHLIYPQFATHNAHTLSAIYYMAGNNYYPGQYEFQCLYGMGELLYQQVVGKVTKGKLNRSCRIYAPVGSYETLLAYLVRRLLENGANTSFVNQIADTTISLDELLTDPISLVESMAVSEGQIGLPHPRIALPRALYGQKRLNSKGLDLSSEQELASLSRSIIVSSAHPWRAEPIINGMRDQGLERPVINPAESDDIVGYVRESTVNEVERAFSAAIIAGPFWDSTSPKERASILECAATLMEDRLPNLLSILIREAGKTFKNAISEVREAIDFLYYYASQIRHAFIYGYQKPLGPVVCISPWNFPLAIFVGQIAAALAAGNSVLAKPAEQAPLIAMQAVRILIEAGIPQGVLQLLPGNGEIVGAALVGDARVRGVIFTGSTEVARILKRSIAGRLDAHNRPIPFIAETGGLNAMIVDSSALPEQVITDVVASAFDSAGQRCSSLRILCIQEEIADYTLKMLRGAMDECRMGNPGRLSSDIGPVIDIQAKNAIEDHIQVMRANQRTVYQAAKIDDQYEKEWTKGTFVKPTLIEIRSIAELKKETFGPVLHAIRFHRANLAVLIDQINASGYGLTLGIHSRIDETIDEIIERAKVGNFYVNRNMIGAVVGVQPFGGKGLSGTGPKSGGPLYLYHLLSNRTEAGISRAFSLHGPQQSLKTSILRSLLEAHRALKKWARDEQKNELLALVRHYGTLSHVGKISILNGPTGERNTYTLLPRERILCLAEKEGDVLIQLAAVLAVGSRALWPEDDVQRSLYLRLPDEVRARITFTKDWIHDKASFDAAIYHGESYRLSDLCQKMAQREGAIVSVQAFASGETQLPLERLIVERSVSVNTAASGGDTSLVTIC